MSFFERLNWNSIFECSDDLYLSYPMKEYMVCKDESKAYKHTKIICFADSMYIFNFFFFFTNFSLIFFLFSHSGFVRLIKPELITTQFVKRKVSISCFNREHVIKYNYKIVSYNFTTRKSATLIFTISLAFVFACFVEI